MRKEVSGYLFWGGGGTKEAGGFFQTLKGGLNYFLCITGKHF